VSRPFAFPHHRGYRYPDRLLLPHQLGHQLTSDRNKQPVLHMSDHRGLLRRKRRPGIPGQTESSEKTIIKNIVSVFKNLVIRLLF
jgi:hypothetical protein